MMERQTISIAIPVYNGAEYLGEALASIAAQTDQDFELVVSDNCSTDDTTRILADFAASHPNVVVSRSDRFILQGENVNRVMSLCTGQWVKLLCHDDLLDPACIATMRETLGQIDSASVGVVGHDEQWLFANGHRTTTPRYEPFITTWNGREYLQSHLNGEGVPVIPSLTTAMVNRAAFDASAGFDPRYVHFDHFYWLRLMLKWDYVFVNKILTVNRIHGAQVAVAARNTLSSVFRDAGFWPEFLAEAGSLRLSRRAAWSLRLKPIAHGATYIAIELIKGRPAAALSMMRQLPVHWWPLLPPLVLRAFRRERSRTRELSRHVPLPLIYP